MQGQGTPSGRAAGTIRPYRFVYHSGSEDHALLECNAADRPIGISTGSAMSYDSDYHATDGYPVYLQSGRVQKVECGGTVTVGYPCGPNADGEAVEGGGGYAIALETGADGTIIEVLFLPALGTGICQPSITCTAATTLTEQSSGAIVDNLGAEAAVCVTLPSAPPEGTWFEFVVKAAQQLQIDPGSASGIYIGGAKTTDDNIIWADDEGESLKLVADSAGDWAALYVTGTWTETSN